MDLGYVDVLDVISTNNRSRISLIIFSANEKAAADVGLKVIEGIRSNTCNLSETKVESWPKRKYFQPRF